MFDKPIQLYGQYCLLLKKYTKDNGTENDVPWEVSDNMGGKKKVFLFDTLIKCYMVACILGINEKRSIQYQHKTGDKDATIFTDAVNKNRDRLLRIYRHMVLTVDTDLSIDARIKKAFSQFDICSGEDEQRRMDSYARGGLLIIDEIFSACSSYEDVGNAIFDLVERAKIE